MPLETIIPLRTIGSSATGKSIQVRHFGAEHAPLRVFFLCGQHGDERAVQRSLRAFLARVAGLPGILDPRVQVAALELANPDGSVLRARANVEGIDLNRDHLLLRAPETNSIHHFVANWRPHFIVDMHNYPSRRLHLLNRNLRLAWDLCLDFPTNPAIEIRDGHPLLASLAEQLACRLSASGYRFGRYTIIQANGSVRHGTPQMVDARNVLALRFGIPVVLMESRNPSKLHGPLDHRRLREATVLACQELLRWCVEHTEILVEMQAEPQTAGRVPLRYRRRRAATPAEIPVIDLTTGEAGTLPFSPYRPSVEGRKSVSLPFAYAVPVMEESVIALLYRHGYQSVAVEPGRRYLVEEFSPTGTSSPQVRPDPRSGRVPLVRYVRSLHGFVLFPTSQLGGRMLALLLEAESHFGIQRHEGMLRTAAPGCIFPVRRVIAATRKSI
jgi:hypothetical protein